MNFQEEIKYPFECMGFNNYKDYAICLTCGEKVGGGLFPKVLHWGECAGKGYVEALKNIYQDKKGIGESLTVTDIDNLNDNFFKK